MQHLIKKIIDQEFAANSMEVICRVDERAWQFDKVTDYRIRLLFRGSQPFMEIYCAAHRPFKPKMKPNNPVEPIKLLKLCEIIEEAFKEIERLSTPDDFK
ncbi:hypothetical protein [Carboxylicivirga marina]|uniref:hypothetical protein n=1 Tax=Carboxylicivirga marina TaxID=2800988 RepID=UPI0025969D7D|nr:hypothetical protein [uncultured Carboxylicivirga sp.]